MIKLIISDLDGVLITSREIHFLALNKALAEVDNKYIISEEEHLSTYDGLPTKRKLEMLTKGKNLPTSYYGKIFQNKQKYTQELLLNKVQRNERLIDIFRKLKAHGYKVWVASNAIRDTVKTILLKQGILEHIDSFMSNEDVKNNKPSPEIYQKIMIQEGILPSETLIIEDSYIGLTAAWESGANVCPVKNPNDFTEDKLNEYLNINYPKNNKWIDKKLNIVVPMAGMGSRFIEGGFTDPKPLIKVKDKLMIQLVCENLNIDANYIFIVRKEHYEKYNLKSILNIIAPNCQIIQVNEVTEGAACTVLLAKQYINNDNPLIIANSDQFIEWNSGEFYHSFLNTENCDGIILTFEADDKKWSYAKTDENGLVTEVKEKDVISKHATCLHYDTSVLMANGKYELIGKLVNQQSKENVLSFNTTTKKFEEKQITGWVKKIDKNANWYKLSFVDSNNTSYGDKQRIHITGDHEVYTNNGKKRVDMLNDNDKILTKYLKPNHLQQEFIDGSMLGDAFYKKPNNKGEKGRLTFKHGNIQMEWFNKKMEIFKDFEKFIHIEDGKQQQEICGHLSETSGSITCNFGASPHWNNERKRWYINNIKKIPNDFKLTPLIMAVWYMDDGSLGYTNERLILCTDNFDDDSIKILQKELLRFNIISNIWNKGKGKRIVISNGGKDNIYHNSAFLFFDLISKYIIPYMQYKLPEAFRDSYNDNNLNLGLYENYYSDIIVEKIKYEDIKANHPHLYCLEIEDNHNFIAGNMLVSNCGIYGYRKGSDFVKYSERMIEKNIRVNNEFYVCPVYNEFIKDNKIIRIYDVKKMWGLGVPSDLHQYLNEYKK